MAPPNDCFRREVKHHLAGGPVGRDLPGKNFCKIPVTGDPRGFPPSTEKQEGGCRLGPIPPTGMEKGQYILRVCYHKKNRNWKTKPVRPNLIDKWCRAVLRPPPGAGGGGAGVLKLEFIRAILWGGGKTRGRGSNKK